MKKSFIILSLLFLSLSIYAQKMILKDLPLKADPVEEGVKLVKNYLRSEYRHFDEIPGPPPFTVYPETCIWLGH